MLESSEAVGRAGRCTGRLPYLRLVQEDDMPWVRIEDTFPEHPKVQTLSSDAFRLYVTALCYANRNLTDGYLPGIAVQAMGGSHHKKYAQALVMAGLWEVARGGFAVHDYLAFQPTRESVLKRRAADRFRKGIHSESARNPSAPYPSRTQVSIETGTPRRTGLRSIEGPTKRFEEGLR